MKHLVSVSGGKDSTATLVMAIEQHGRENVLGAFADTGNEHPAVYGYIDYLEAATGVPIRRLKRDLTPEWWRRRDYVRDTWPVKLVKKDGFSEDDAVEIVDRTLAVLEAGPTGNPYLDLCVIKGRFPSRMAQYCTQWLKTEPLTEYAMELIEAHGVVWSWQGVRVDESHARMKRHHISGHLYTYFEQVGGGSVHSSADPSLDGRRRVRGAPDRRPEAEPPLQPGVRSRRLPAVHQRGQRRDPEHQQTLARAHRPDCRVGAHRVQRVQAEQRDLLPVAWGQRNGECARQRVEGRRVEQDPARREDLRHVPGARRARGMFVFIRAL